MEIAGGVVANSLNTGMRFYQYPHKPDELRYIHLLKNPYIFSALHIYPLVVGLLFGQVDWFYGLFWYGYMMIATVLILRAPLYLERPVAMLLIFFSILINLYLVEAIPGFEWLIPALFLKILYGHLVREEPYRPILTQG